MNPGSISSPDSSPHLSEPWNPTRIILASDVNYEELHAGVLDYSRSRGWLLDASMINLVGLYPSLSNCAGIIGRIDREPHRDWIASSECPLVQVTDGRFHSPQWPTVVCDYEAWGRLGAQHLLELGDIHFGHYRFFSDSPSINAVYDGFIREMEAHGREVHRLDIGKSAADIQRSGMPRHARVLWLRERLLKLPLPMAIMSADDRYAVDIAIAARSIGLRIPEDIAILGAEDLPFIRRVVMDEISSIDANFREIGRLACELLDRMMQGAAPGSADVPILTKIPPKRVVLRQSTATFTCDHPGVTAAALFVRANFHQDITVTDVARHAHMPIRKLQTMYPEKVGRTIKNDILHRRLKATEALLESTDLKLRAVAAECGFKNDQYLCTMFRHRYGITPQEWRRKHRVE